MFLQLGNMFDDLRQRNSSPDVCFYNLVICLVILVIEEGRVAGKSPH
jgi:hypothetical protein